MRTILLAVDRGSPGGDGDGTLAAQVLAGQRMGIAGNFLCRAGGDDFTAVDAGSGSDIDDEVGRVDGVFVVFDDDNGIAQVTQKGQGFQQAIVVALMQADRRLVENIHHADQPGADLAGQANSLRLAARQGFCTALIATGNRGRR